MKLTATAKVLTSVLVLLGFLAFALVVEFGWNAGRIHSGVTIHGYDVGGLTLDEATVALEERGEMLGEKAITFTRPGITFNFLPTETGWGPRAFETAEEAMRVGRDGMPFTAIADRLRAWTVGVKVPWAGEVVPSMVGNLMDEIEVQAEALGYEIRRKALRRRIKRAIVSYPNRVFKIPLEP